MLDEFPVSDWGSIVSTPPSLIDDFAWLEFWADDAGEDYTGEEGEGD